VPVPQESLVLAQTQPPVLVLHCWPDGHVPHEEPHALGTEPQVRVPQLGVHPHMPGVPLPPHVFGVEHTPVQLPQWLLSVFSSTQLVPHKEVVLSQVQPHWLFAQVLT
jgi:hypothetical protein